MEIKRAGLIYLLVLALPMAAWPQKKKATDSRIVVVAGKPMTYSDSTAVKQLFFSALREKTIENYGLASELFNRILQTDPANDASMYELAKIKLGQKDSPAALDLLEKAVTVNPDNEYYWQSLANVYQAGNDTYRLENAFNQLIRINPANPEYLFNKANILFQQQKYDEALAVYKQLETDLGLTDDIIAGRQRIYLKQGKVDFAAAELEEMIKAYPGQMRYYLLLGEVYNSNNFADKALSVLLKAEKINPNDARVHLALADIYRDKKNNEACFSELKLAFAIADLNIDQKIGVVLGYVPKFPDANAKQSALELSRIIVETHPTDARAQALYGDMLMQNDHLKDAKAAYKKAVSLNDRVYAIWDQLVRLELTDNSLNDAIKDGEEALSVFPNQAWMNYLVGVAWLQNKNYTKALGYLNNVPSLESVDKSLLSQNYSAVGDCYHSLKNDKKSDDAYGKALEYNPDNAYTLNNFAYYLSIRNEQLDRAATMSKHAIDLQPNTASFEDTYAWILFKQKKYTEAKTWIDKAIASDKGKSAVQVEHLGDIMFYMGDAEGAIANWKKAKQSGGGSPLLDRKINEKKYVE